VCDVQTNEEDRDAGVPSGVAARVARTVRRGQCRVTATVGQETVAAGRRAIDDSVALARVVRVVRLVLFRACERDVQPDSTADRVRPTASTESRGGLDCRPPRRYTNDAVDAADGPDGKEMAP
jgi:hypothetical protein